jgi:hypothetical protein
MMSTGVSRPSFCICVHQNEQMAKMGRRTKGDRDTLVVRVMRPMGDTIRRNANECGISINDYVTAILARELEMPEYVPVVPADDQFALPMNQRMTA